jgi:heme exporter protein A
VLRHFVLPAEPQPKVGGERVMQLTAVDLACVRAGRAVFQNLRFAVQGGEMLAVTGPNGAGKSSLLRLIAGLVRPTQGRLTLDGSDCELSIAEQAHYVGHQDAHKPSLTVGENLAFWNDVLGGANGVATALACVGLDALAQLPALYLSAGQRRRLSLARLLAKQRPIWLLDEPGSALDTAGQAVLAEIMRTHLAGGGIIVTAIHRPIELEAAQELRLGERR